MLADKDISFTAAQDDLYFTEKGFYVGLTFPGSAAVDAILRGGDAGDILTGLASLTPTTRTLAQLANADNGVAAGMAVVNIGTGSVAALGDASRAARKADQGWSKESFTKALKSQFDPLQEFRDAKGNITAESVASSVGLPFSWWNSAQYWSESQSAELSAGGDIVMKAGLDVVLAQGTQLVAGDDVTINAGRDVIMTALLDYARDKSQNFGLQLSLNSIGFDIGQSKGYDETLSNAGIKAGGDVKIGADRDVLIAGGNIAGERVSLDVGRDLSILSPQAEGWRDGFSFGLTVGVGTFGIRGSYEEGDKAWSSGSSIVAEKGIDILVGEDTVLNGALLQATDGDIKLDTKTLTVSDNHDKDEYLNVGGSIGISGNRLDTLSFHYEEKDKQGETRTTLDAAGNLDVTVRDADGDGVENTEADKAAAEELIAGINKDASRWQEITKNDYINISGELDVKNLLEFGKNVATIGNYVEAMTEPVPDGVAAEGPENVDYYRRLRSNGLSPDQAQKLLETPELQHAIGVQQNFNEAVLKYGSRDDIPKATLALILAGYDFDAISEGVGIGGCGTAGNCYVVFKDRDPREVAELAKSSFIQASEQYRLLISKYNAGTLSAEEKLLFDASVDQMTESFKVYALCNFLTLDPKESANAAYMDLVSLIGDEQHSVNWYTSFGGKMRQEARGLVIITNVANNLSAFELAGPLLEAMDAVDMAMLSAGIVPGSLAAKSGKFVVTPVVKGAAWFKSLAQKYGDDVAERMAATYGPKSRSIASASAQSIKCRD